MKMLIPLFAAAVLSACSGREAAPAGALSAAPAARTGTSHAGASGTAAAPAASAGTSGAAAAPSSVSPLSFDVIAVGIVKSQVGAEVKVGSQLSGIVAKLHV